MFTPQQKGPSRWSVSPRIRDGLENGSAVNPGAATGAAFLKSKGKSVAEVPPPPPRASLGGGGGGGDGVDSGGDPDVWRRFHEAGMLDESSLQRKDREALVQRISELQKELYEYQYNMGLLLIEKKDWSSNLEEVRQALAIAEETLKREQAAHFFAISDFEDREENLKKALGVEKQCVADLEKALREMRSETAEAKFTSDKKLTEAHVLEAGLAEKYLEIEEKLHKADANLAEASRRRSEVDRKLEDLEDRERKLQKEYQSLSSERKMHEKDITEQRNYLRDWEKRLQDGHKRSLERQQILTEREDHANEAVKLLEKKESELEDSRKMIETMKVSLKIKEEDITTRLNSLVTKEKKADLNIEILENKEKELIAREEKLDSRERVEIKKLLDEHNTMLDSKKRVFELDLEERRNSFDEEMQAKVEEMEIKKREIDHIEDQMIKREQALEKGLQKLDDKERDLDAKSKALKKWEDSLKIDEEKCSKERHQLARDLEELLKSKSKLESLKATIEAGKEQIVKEEENLRLKREEREEHLVLQSKLKQEIEDYRMMKESLSNDMEDLRRQKEKFEEEWDLLDERKLALERDIKKFNDDMEKFEKWQSSEEGSLKNEAREVKVNIERELEELRQNKEAFEKTMEHERLNALEFLKTERSDMDRELELRKHELEMDMRKKQEDMEKKLNDRENDFQKRRDIELDQLKSLSNLNETKIQKLKMEQDRLQREKESISVQRKQLEVDQLDVQKDIDSLSRLSKNLKYQREELMKERERFLALAAQCDICKNCGHKVADLEFFSLPDTGNIQLPRLAFEDDLKAKNTETSPMTGMSHPTTSGGHLSWLQKCSKMFSLSPTKKSEEHCQMSSGTQLDKEGRHGDAICGAAPSNEPAVDSLDMAESGSRIREIEESERLVEAGEDPEASFGVADNSIDVLTQTDNGVRKRLCVSYIDQNEKEVSSAPQDYSQIELSKQGRRQVKKRGRPKGVRRTHTMKAVIEEAKVILGDASNKEKDGQHIQDFVNSLDIQEDSQGDSVHAGMVATSAAQKRRFTETSTMSASELDAEDNEACSESISVGRRRKRRQISVPGTQTPAEKRYNFRHSTIVGSSAGQTLPDQTKDSKTGGSKKSTRKGAAKPGIGSASENVADSAIASAIMQQKPKVTGHHEISSQKLVHFEMEELHAHAESKDDIVAKSVEFGGQSRDDNGFVMDGASAEASEPATPSNGECSEDKEDEDGLEKQNASIGKKLWTFFTT